MCEPVRVACLGDSLTRGDGSHEARQKSSLAGRGNYPMRLQRLLGTESATVLNFGHGGATACNGSDIPYLRTREFRRALQWRPHLLILMLGTNDGKDKHWGSPCGAAALHAGLTAIS